MSKRKAPLAVDHGLSLLLDYQGRLAYLPGGYWIKFEISQGPTSAERPHGLSYSFTLHDSSNRRMLGFDNAHAVKPLGRNAKRPKEYDHWHRSGLDKGRPYQFVDAATLIKDFFDAVEGFLNAQGLNLEVVGERTMDDASPRKTGKSS